MDTVLELAFEGLRLVGRLLLHLVMEIVGEAIGRLCGRIWRRIHGWVAWVTGLSGWITAPITILLIFAIVVGAFVLIVKVGQAIFV